MGKRIKFFLITISSLNACLIIFWLANNNKGVSMKNESAEGDEFFEKTKTVCIGRFLIDVPETAKIIYGPADVSLSIERYAGEGSKINEIVKSRLLEIEQERFLVSYALRKSTSRVGSVIDGSMPYQKIVFGVSKASGSFYRIQSYVRLEDDLFVQEGEAYGEESEYSLVINTMNSIASKLRSRADGEISSGEGICIDGGFVSGTSQLDYENLTLGIRLSEFPDVHFSLATSLKPKLVDSDALEPRLHQAEEFAKRNGKEDWYSRIKIFRRGERKIGKWEGFEVLARKPQQSSERDSHEFLFVSQGQPNNPLLPVLKLSLNSGLKKNSRGAVLPSITDNQAILLWDKITSSIRERPTENI
jgi:hypothetical protein